MKKNKYAASLDTISRPQNKVGIKKTDCYVDAAIAKAIEEGERRNHERLVAAVSTLFGEYGPLYAGNVAIPLIKIFNLHKKENFERLKKNVEDGYTPWFIYRFYYKLRCIESTIYPFEYGIYERDQTYGIQDFKKRFTPSAWKALVKLPACRQFSLSRWYQCDRALEILAKCLHIGTDSHALEWLVGFISEPVSMDLIEEILLFLKKCDKSPNTLSTAAKDIIDHIGMWDSLQKLKIKYPEIVKNLGVPLSGKWSLRRFADEHSRLSQMKRDCDRDQILEKERREKWKKKSFFNIHKFPQLKGSTIKVNGIELHVKLINNGTDLFDEGSKMHHCIFDYIRYMRAGTYFAFSITDTENPRNCCTIAFSIQDKTRNDKAIYGTIVPSTNYNDQIKHIVFNQVRGLRNHVKFTFQQEDLVNELAQFMEATGFKDYITDLSKRPLYMLRFKELRKLVINTNINYGPFLGRDRMYGRDFDRGAINGIPGMATLRAGGYPGFFHRPHDALLTNLRQQALQALPDGRDFVNNFFYENDPIPRDNSRFLRAGLERFRESLIGGLNNVVNAFGQGVRSALAQPNTVSDYNEQTGNVIQRTVSNHYPRPEVKEKPFLNSDFLKTVSNG